MVVSWESRNGDSVFFADKVLMTGWESHLHDFVRALRLDGWKDGQERFFLLFLGRRHFMIHMAE
jgi:hypothetical protein